MSLAVSKRRGPSRSKSVAATSEQSRIANKALALAASASKQLGRSMSTCFDDDCISSGAGKAACTKDERFCLFVQPAPNEAPFHRLAIRWGDKDESACNVGQEIRPSDCRPPAR